MAPVALPALNLGTALAVGVGLLILFILIRVVLKITHIVVTVGCLAIIVIAVIAVFFSGAGQALLAGR